MQTATSVGVRKLCLMSTVDDESVCVRKREMASANPRPPERPLSTEPDISKSALLYERFVLLNQELLTKGVPASRLKITAKSDCPSTNDSSPVFLWCLMPVIVGVLMFFGSYDVLDGTMKSALSVKCVLPNNYVVWEATRPVTDCRICQNLSSVIVVNNLTRTDFKPFAYSYKPIIVKGAALDWLAVKVFDFQFFKKLYDSFPDAHKSVEEDCQFLNFKSNFSNLEEVFAMSPKRAANSDGTQPWYIGWSNCHPEVLREMRKYYSKPHFLPEDAEHSHIDFVFMGYQQGAFMHLDYISRLMWQAQLRGRKSWRLTPPPECERVCSTISFTVQPGDILLLDTRQWYHDTYVLNNEFSLTVSSEYG